MIEPPQSPTGGAEGNLLGIFAVKIGIASCSPVVTITLAKEGDVARKVQVAFAPAATLLVTVLSAVPTIT